MARGGYVALVALRPLMAHREVFNTYGELANRMLLTDYGFALRRNPLDEAELPWTAVRAAAAARLPGGERELRARERTLRTSACARCFDELTRELTSSGDGGGDDGGVRFSFDWLGRPPADLLLLLWYLLAEPHTAPGWMLQPRSAPPSGGGLAGPSEQDAAIRAAQAFIALPPDAQLHPPTPTRVPPADVLRAAIRSHLASLPPMGRPGLQTAGSRAQQQHHHQQHQRASAPAAGDRLDERAEYVAALVEGERRIWERALSLLETCAGGTGGAQDEAVPSAAPVPSAVQEQAQRAARKRRRRTR